MFYIFIACCLAYRTEFDKHWPLKSCTKAIIKKNYKELTELLDADFHLIGLMQSRDCFTRQQLKSIESSTDISERNAKLLDILTRRSDGDFGIFVQCIETTQPHLVPLLTGDTGKQPSNCNFFLCKCDRQRLP